MKKAIILLILILVFAFIAACGNEPESPTQEAPATTEAQETPVPTPEPEIEEVSMTQYIEEEVDELSDVRVFINNRQIEFRNQQPFAVNNTPMVPLAEIIRLVGVNYGWYEEDGVIVLSYYEESALLHINDTNALASTDNTGWNFKTVRMRQAPILVEGTPFIPILYLEQIFGIEMEWNETERTLIINYDREEKEKRAREEHNELLNSFGMYVQFETEHFIFRSTNADRRMLEEIKNAIYEAIPTILVAFRIEMPRDLIVIELHPSLQTMKASYEFVCRGEGIAFGAHATIVNSDGSPSTNTGLHHNLLPSYVNNLRDTAAIHEVTHTIMKSTYGQPDNFMNEGVTIMVSESYVFNYVFGIHHNNADYYVDFIRRTNPLPSLEDLRDLYGSHDQIGSDIGLPVHNFGHMFVEWMIINFGWDVVLEYLVTHQFDGQRTTGRPLSLETLTGLSMNELNNMWLDFLRNYSRQDRDLALSILMESIEHRRAA